jgi:hypothetical protein
VGCGSARSRTCSASDCCACCPRSSRAVLPSMPGRPREQEHAETDAAVVVGLIAPWAADKANLGGRRERRGLVPEC